MKAANRERRVAGLFAASLERPPAERAAFLTAACGGDPGLREEIESLLDAHDRSEGFLDTLRPEAVAGLVAAGERAVGWPEQIGPYRIVGELGRGGMGRVLLAERADGQFEQQVALKVIRGDVGSPEAVARFLRERQILARLRHPGIANLLDGGVMPDGRPWFAMECVDGQPITTYCDTRALAIDDRLGLFLEIAEAVAHAHRHRVIHRDLKPSNILVTTEGRVKLLDFGIAKSLEEIESGSAAETRTAMRILTPEYAAPEQVRGEPVTAASDIYALGAVLYELLSGQRLQHFDSYAPAELARVVCDTDPPPPSRAAGSHQPALPRRGRGDLDAIVLRALRKEPERRYASVEGLLEDLARFRDGRPVLARHGSRTYRARKFFARHRVRLTIGGLALALTATAAVLAYRARATAREAGRLREMEAYARTLQDGIPSASVADSATGRILAALRQGRRIGFASSRGGRAVDFYVVEADSAMLVLEDATQPSWSPDGTRIAFERDGDIYLATADGSAPRRLTSEPGFEGEQSWSPDGRQIAFAGTRDGNTDVYVINTDGRERTRLTRDPAFDGQPTWSPDGRRIAFNSSRAGNMDIFVMNRDGSGQVNLTRHPLWDIEPVWSPDGRRIAFPSTRDGNFEIFVINADGSGLTNLTRHPAADGEPVWSPDGSMIAFASNRRGNYDVYVMRADGTPLGNLTTHPAEDMWPTWR